MPNLDPKSIINLNNLMRKSNFKIGTLASSLKKNEFYDNNVVKVYVQNKLEKFNFYRAKALDFFRQPGLYHKIEKLYHHIGIYAFRIETLSKYVKLKRTKNELKRNLEQMRAVENNIDIIVAFSKSAPLGVDTKEDFLSIKKSMEYKN